MRKSFAVVAFLAYIATIFAANWAIEVFGVVPVGFGLMAPAAVYFVGLAFTFRDVVHELVGAGGAFIAILIGAALSALVSPALALASGAAFLFSETADLIVYSPLREKHLPAAVAASNVVGLIIDSFIFLTLAFGSLEFLSGQVVGKAWMTLLALPFIYGVRHKVRQAVA